MAAPTGVTPAARRILVAVEDGINRHILASVLADEGHALAFAGDGASALEMARRQVFDLVLMDGPLPVMDGLEATRQIRRLPGAAGGVPILVLGANATALGLAQQAAAGVTGSLSKPFEWDRIMAAIERHALRPAVGSAAAEPASLSAALLVDAGVLGGLQARLGPGDLEAMARTAIDAYGLACDQMLQGPGGPAAIAGEVHKIRGSAGTFGLMRISALAGAVEDAVEHGLAIDGLLRQLALATRQTRDELLRMGALGDETSLAG